LYALGLLLGGNIKQFALSPAELAIVRAGLSDAATGAKPLVEIETYGPKVNELAQKRAAAGAEETKKRRARNSRTTSRNRAERQRRPPAS
jgi:FKBP-type peptidyl-prolyl cis-trans isomerase FkpA